MGEDDLEDLLDKAETGLSKPNWWQVMMMIMMMLWCQNIGGIRCKCSEWVAGGR
jgi:hypothetical protein